MLEVLFILTLIFRASFTSLELFLRPSTLLPVSAAVDPEPKGYTPSVLLSLVAVYVIWSSTYLALRYAVVGMPPFLVVGTRYFTAGLILFGIARLSGQRAPQRREWSAALPAGILLFVSGNGFVAYAEQTVSSSLAAMACAAMPIFACLFEAFAGTRTSRGEWLGIALGFAGVVVLCAGDLRAQPLPGMLLALAPIGWALGSSLTRRMPRAPGVMHAAAQLLCGGASNMLVAAFRGEHLPPSLPARAIWAWAYLVVFGSVVAFTAFSHLLLRTRTAVATSYAYVNPVLAVVLGVLVGGEHLGAGAFVAGALVVAGVAIAINAARR
jgi:drug/metabolite transporter (DMT)-like permease